MKKIKNPWSGKESYFCFGCASNNEAGLKMEFYEEGETIVSYWTPEAKYQGWIDTLHGGIQVALLDEICGWVVFRKLQTAGVTSKMETRYLRPILTTEPQLTIQAHIRELKRNLAFIDARILNSKGEICTEASCTYYTFSKEKAEKDFSFIECKTEE